MTTVYSKERSQIINEVWKLPLILIKEKELADNCNSDGTICEKALQICNCLLKKTPSMSAEGDSEFACSQ